MSENRERKKSAYESYRTRSRVKQLLPAYEVFEGDFESDKDFRSVGLLHGLSREMIRRIYGKFFSTPEKPNGRIRSHLHTQAKGETQDKERRNHRFSVAVSEAAGHLVEAELLPDSLKLSVLRLNGHLCKFTAVSRCDNWYHSQFRELGEAKFLLAQGEDFDGSHVFYIIPAESLIGEDRVRIPALPASDYHKGSRKLRLRQFKGRWDLLGGLIEAELVQMSTPRAS